MHLHSLVTDGVFLEESPDGPVTFHRLPPPTDEEVTAVAWETCRRTRDLLIRRGLWREDLEQPDTDPMTEGVPELADLYGASVRGVLSLGPRRGQRLVRFFGAAAGVDIDPEIRAAGYGFDLHARQSVAPGDRVGLSRLVRYVLRPPLAQDRIELAPDGRVVLHLKRAWRDGTRAVVFDPLDFLTKLVALVPPPRANVIRFHGVYAPNARLRRAVVPEPPPVDQREGSSITEERFSRTRCSRLPWAELLRLVFAVDVFECPRCGSSSMQRIAWITDSETIRRILRAVGLSTDSPELSPPRSPEEIWLETHAV